MSFAFLLQVLLLLYDTETTVQELSCEYQCDLGLTQVKSSHHACSWDMASLLSFRLFEETIAAREKNRGGLIHFGLQTRFCYYGSFLGRHLTSAMLEPYRCVGDPELDHIFDLFEREAGSCTLIDIVEKVEEIRVKDVRSQAEEELYNFSCKYASSKPAWFVKEAFQRGQRALLQYLPSYFVSLFYRCLIPGFSISHLTEVLKKTAYLAPPSSTRRVRTRLLDTGAFVAAVITEDPDRLWQAALRVRFLHGQVRRRVPSGITQEDLAATLIAFSLHAMGGVEMILGARIPTTQLKDILHVWRYTGWLLGVHTCDESEFYSKLLPLDPCGPGWIPSEQDEIGHCTAMFHSMVNHLVHPDKSSIEMAQHLVRMGSQDYSTMSYYRALQCRRFVGDSLADGLNLPIAEKWTTRWKVWVFSSLFLYTARAYTVINRWIFPTWSIWLHHRWMSKFWSLWSSSKSCPFALMNGSKKEA